MFAHSNTLIRLVYSSQLKAEVSADVIADIVRVSESRNKAQAITGMLAIDERRVCQILEGPHDAVVALYRSIERDSRHEGIVELSRKPIDKRAYEAWGMTQRSMAEAAMVAFSD